MIASQHTVLVNFLNTLGYAVQDPKSSGAPSGKGSISYELKLFGFGEIIYGDGQGQIFTDWEVNFNCLNISFENMLAEIDLVIQASIDLQPSGLSIISPDLGGEIANPKQSQFTLMIRIHD